MLDRGWDTLFAQWSGRHWRWWSLVAGVLLVPVTALLAGLIAVLTGESFEPLLLLLLVVEILAVSLIGSGFIDSLTEKMIRGGLARDSSEYVGAREGPADAAAQAERDQAARDRITIRAGLIVLPLIAAFIYFMTQI